ncbi:MAG: ABC transporter permease [Rhizobiaceae bacterium]|nr:MAG: ABC transporter permease [Rhizobiaceae bacterium]
MFLRFVSQSIRRAPRRKAMTVAAVAMGTAVATAMLGVMLDIGDRVNRELRSLGANLAVTPRSHSLPVEIGGIDYRPVSREDYIPEAQIPKIKATFWQLNITGFAPTLHAMAQAGSLRVPVDGVWFDRQYRAPDGTTQRTGVRALNAAWKVRGRWIDDRDRDDQDRECLVGAALARRLRLEPGGALTLFGEPFTVSGILSTGAEEDDRAFVRLEVLQRLTRRPGQADSVQVGALTKPEDDFARKDPAKMTRSEYDRWYCTPYVSSIAHQIQEVLPMAVAKPVWRVADNEGKVLGKIRGLMLLITLAALASAGLTVWSVMATTVLERRAEIAIMQATGASNWLVAALFAAEVGAEGAAGGLLGALAGSALAGWVGQAVFHSPTAAPALLVPLAVVVAVAVAVAGAAQPLRRSLALEPAIALRGGA